MYLWGVHSELYSLYFSLSRWVVQSQVECVRCGATQCAHADDKDDDVDVERNDACIHTYGSPCACVFSLRTVALHYVHRAHTSESCGDVCVCSGKP